MTSETPSLDGECRFNGVRQRAERVYLPVDSPLGDGTVLPAYE